MMTTIKKKIQKLLGISACSEFNSIGKDIHVGFAKGITGEEFKGPHMSFEQSVKLLKESMNDFRPAEPKGDSRYNTPKEKHKASEEAIDHTLATNEIYQKANKRLNKGQRGQIGYGLDKYPEPLTASTWTIFETLDHIMDESIDKMHYMEMLREKFHEMDRELEELREFKRKVEAMGGEPFNVYVDNYVGTDTKEVDLDDCMYRHIIAGADHDGDVVRSLLSTHFVIDGEEIIQYPKSDIRFHVSEDITKEESTYIKQCKKATKAAHREKVESDLSEIKERVVQLGDISLATTIDVKILAKDIANEMYRLDKHRHTTGMGF